MIKHTLTAAAIALSSLAAQADTLALWNFNDSDLVVDLGAGTAALVGGTSTSGFNSGGTSSDPVQPGIGWSISSFAAQGSGDKTRGASFTVSTLGYENIRFSYDMRHSNTAAGHEVVQYSVDGSTFVDLVTYGTDNLGAPIVFALGRGADLSAIAAADNQATLRLRVVATFAPGTSSYASSNTGASYGTSGTWRFDMVSISGTPIPAVPEPATTALLLGGLALLGALARRRAG